MIAKVVLNSNWTSCWMAREAIDVVGVDGGDPREAEEEGAEYGARAVRGEGFWLLAC